MTQWTVHGRRAIYESPWISLDLVDVEQPDGDRYEQHVVRMARPVAATVMTDAAGRALLMWRHRHVTDTWGWEIPSGRIEAGEAPEHAAAREAEEETGWCPGPLQLLVASQPSNGSIDTVHYIFHADGARKVGEPADGNEAERIEWVPLAEVRSLIAKGEIVSGPTLIGLLLADDRHARPGRLPAGRTVVTAVRVPNARAPPLVPDRRGRSLARIGMPVPDSQARNPSRRDGFRLPPVPEISRRQTDLPAGNHFSAHADP